MARKVAAALGGELRGKTIAVLGLTFKPNTDDMREAPSLALITALQDQGAQGPRLRPGRHGASAKALLPDITYCDGPYAAAEAADALVIVTEWEQFRALDLGRLKQVMARPVIVDLKNVYRPGDVERAGFTYANVGRAKA